MERKFIEHLEISKSLGVKDFFVLFVVTVHGKTKIDVVEKMLLIGLMVKQFIEDY